MRIRGARKSFIGLDIGTRTIGAVQLGRTLGTNAWVLEAATLMARSAPPGSALTADEIGNVAGVLDRQGFSGHRVVIAAPEAMKVSAILELPPRSSGAPIGELARQEVARAAKRDPGEIEVEVWDVPAPGRGAGSGDGTHVLAVGLAHEDAERLLGAVEGSGLEVEALECRCCAMARAAAGLMEGREVSAILELADGCASIAVMHSGTVAYDRPVMEVGLERLRERLKSEIRVDDQAVEYLMGVLTRGEGDGGIEGESIGAAGKIVEEHAGMVVQELRSVIAYAIHRYPGAIGPVMLMGSGARLRGLSERIASDLDLEARVVLPRDVAGGGSVAGAIAGDPSLTVALGMAMRPAASGAMRRAA